jgi:hypothetical protein
LLLICLIIALPTILAILLLLLITPAALRIDRYARAQQ